MKNVLFILLFLPFITNAQSIFISATDTVFCTGSFVTFSATASGITNRHYQWQKNGTNTGTDSIHFTTNVLNNSDTVVCRLMNSTLDTVYAVSEMIILRVDTMPYAGIISGIDKVCVGATITLANTVYGGVWIATNGNASVSNGVVTGIKAGYFECPYPVDETIMYTVTNSCGTDTAFYPISIEPLPNAIFDVMKPWACPFPPGGIVFTGPRCFNSTYFVPTDSSKYSITGYLFAVANNYCGSDTYKYYQKITYYTFVRDTAVIEIANKAVCVGDSILVSAMPGAYTHNWELNSSNASIINDSGSIYVIGKKQGAVTIKLQYSNICGNSMAKPDTVTIQVNAKPIYNPTVSGICIGEKILITDSLAGGTWSSSNIGVTEIDALSGIASAVGAGRATVTYTMPTGCFGTRKIAVDDCGGGIELFPVPAHEHLVVRQLLKSKYSNCTIINTIGKTQHQQALKPEYTMINIEHLALGIYFIIFSNNNEHKTIRFLKE